jgi:hypothetical protein
MATLAETATALLVKVRALEESLLPKLDKVEQACAKLSQAGSQVAESSGSSLGYHSELHYGAFERPALRARFDPEWGGIHGLPDGWADIYLNPDNPSRQAQERDVSDHQKLDPLRFAIPQHWLPYETVKSRRLEGTGRNWSFVFCDVTSALNERTCIPAVIPISLTRSMPAIYVEPPVVDKVLKLVSALSSLPVDYIARLKVATNHLTQGIMDSMPIPPPNAWDPTSGAKLDLSGIRARVLELVYTARDLAPFACACEYSGPPFAWNSERRIMLRSELDAFYLHLYGFSREDAGYILDTFPKIRKRDEQQYGAYRTKRLILEMYDYMAEAERTGIPYQSRLDPPPADPRTAHPGGEP